MIPVAPMRRRAVQQILQNAGRRHHRGPPPGALRCFSVAAIPLHPPFANIPHLGHAGNVRQFRLGPLPGIVVKDVILPSGSPSSGTATLKSFDCVVSCAEEDDDGG